MAISDLFGVAAADRFLVSLRRDLGIRASGAMGATVPSYAAGGGLYLVLPWARPRVRARSGNPDPVRCAGQRQDSIDVGPVALYRGNQRGPHLRRDRRRPNAIWRGSSVVRDRAVACDLLR